MLWVTTILVKRGLILKFKYDSLYYVQFDDHIKDGDEPLSCQVCGWVINDSDKYVTLAWWMPNSADESTNKFNVEKVVILKSTITRKRKLTV